MKILKLIIKGILLYTTVIIILFCIMGIESIYNNGYLIWSIIIIISLLLLCFKTINSKEFELLSLGKFLKDLEELEDKI